ncbi:hypothetical protein OIU79_025020 [Salix purpurea]|uniref:Remorin N-terminal domain-containing protein n=1 Tax=Salix purpurea TaxID=77065 RepID=A0A9Q0W3X3_SALPP|nr:hypothetical protein OIU79_025020 [Salix purpurea]
MAEQEVKKVEAVMPVAPTPVETKSDVAEGKVTAPSPPVAAEKEKAATATEESKALAIVQKTEPAPKKTARKLKQRTGLRKSSMLLPHGRIAKRQL